MYKSKLIQSDIATKLSKEVQKVNRYILDDTFDDQIGMLDSAILSIALRCVPKTVYLTVTHTSGMYKLYYFDGETNTYLYMYSLEAEVYTDPTDNRKVTRIITKNKKNKPTGSIDIKEPKEVTE